MIERDKQYKISSDLRDMIDNLADKGTASQEDLEAIGLMERPDCTGLLDSGYGVTVVLYRGQWMVIGWR